MIRNANLAAFAVIGACMASLVPATSATPLAAQGRVVPAPPPTADTVTVVPGPRYQAGAVRQWLLGSEWRDLWNVPLTLPVLDVETFQGGLTLEEEGGNNQSITLHTVDPEGREWIFRSLDKYPAQKLDFGGIVNWLVQDQVSALHPAGQLVVPVLLEALDILHATPTLYVLPDDPALGEFRETFAGMVGAIELQPNEREGDLPGFAGSSKIVASDEMMERVEEEPIHMVDQHELLRARFLDFIIGDTDRGTDQWRWARYPHPDDPDRFVWRPIPRDRDWTMISGDGVLTTAVRMIYPKHVPFDAELPPVPALVFSSHIVDRWFLNRLTRQDFQQEVERVQRTLTDDVIRTAVAQLPPRYPAEHRQWLAETLMARRDDLPETAMQFYEWLAMAVDVRASDERDFARLDRRPDGSLELTIGLLGEGGALEDPYYRRVFLPSETNEVRVFLHGEDDRAVVTGPSDAIPVRVIGGGSDDVLIDSSTAGSVHFYDGRGDNQFVRGAGTTISTKEYDPPPTPEGIRLGSDWAPDYGDDFGWAPTIDFGEYAGVIVGLGPEWVDYGFRRLPYHWRFSVTPLFALDALKPGAMASFDYRFENSLHSLEADAIWSEFYGIRWFGLGNQAPEVEERLSLVPVDRIALEPSIVWRFGTWRSSGEDETEGVVIEDHTPPGFRASLELGPRLQYMEPEPREGSPYALDADRRGNVFEYGVGAALQLQKVDREAVPRRGFRLLAGAEGYPGLEEEGGTDPDQGGFDINEESFATASLVGIGYLPLIGDMHLALRLGGSHAWGDFPAWHAPTIGGRASIRGYEFMRYAGESAAFGNAELRVPLTEVSWPVRGEVGVLGLTDAGRVWVDGDSEGDWHTAYGGGAWFSGAGQTFSVYYASGDRDQLYLSLGMPF